MTDKEKVIKKLKEALDSLDITSDLRLVLIQTIEYLQEESVSSIWHDASEKSNEPEDVVIINPSDNTGEVLTNCTGVYSGRIWSYTSDLLNLDNPCKIGKNLQEEPVNNELEEAAKHYLYSNILYDDVYVGNPTDKDCIEMFKAGAKWQKEQDQSTIELAEDHAYFAGRTKTTDEIKEALLSEVLPYFMHGGEADEVVAKLDEVLNQKK